MIDRIVSRVVVSVCAAVILSGLAYFGLVR
jgi:hypothetical protein